MTLDGVPQNDPFGGWVIWTGLPSEEIGSAKLVRGAGSGPYGAGALTGVVSLQSIDSVPGGVAGDISYGSFNDIREAITAGTRVGDTQLTAVAGGESSDGYTPVRGPKAGRADIPLDLHSATGAVSATTDFGPIASTVRLSGYEEKRSAGLVGTTSNAKGAQASVTLAEQPTPDRLGWRAQAYISASDLQNSSVSTSADRNTTTPANNQYATPSLGWGLNGALRTGSADRSLEVGADLRGADGQSEETFRVINGAYTRTRFAGGADLVGGLYAEAQQKDGPWLFAEGLRADGWSTYRAHRTERGHRLGRHHARPAPEGSIRRRAHRPLRGATRLGRRAHFSWGRLSPRRRLCRLPPAHPERAAPAVPRGQRHHRGQSRPEARASLWR